MQNKAWVSIFISTSISIPLSTSPLKESFLKGLSLTAMAVMRQQEASYVLIMCVCGPCHPGTGHDTVYVHVCAGPHELSIHMGV